MAWLGTTRWTSSVEEQFNLLNHQWIPRNQSRIYSTKIGEDQKSNLSCSGSSWTHLYDVMKKDGLSWRVARAKTTISRALHCSSNLIFFPPPFHTSLLQVIFSDLSYLDYYMDSVSIVNPKSRRKGIADFPRSFSCSGKILISKWP